MVHSVSRFGKLLSESRRDDREESRAAYRNCRSDAAFDEAEPSTKLPYEELYWKSGYEHIR